MSGIEIKNHGDGIFSAWVEWDGLGMYVAGRTKREAIEGAEHMLLKMKTSSRDDIGAFDILDEVVSRANAGGPFQVTAINRSDRTLKLRGEGAPDNWVRCSKYMATWTIPRTRPQ